MPDITSGKETDRLLSALGEQVAALGLSFELVVVGGSGLLALGPIERSTRDERVLREVLAHMGVRDADLGD